MRCFILVLLSPPSWSEPTAMKIVVLWRGRIHLFFPQVVRNFPQLQTFALFYGLELIHFFFTFLLPLLKVSVPLCVCQEERVETLCLSKTFELLFSYSGLEVVNLLVYCFLGHQAIHWVLELQRFQVRGCLRA